MRVPTLAPIAPLVLLLTMMAPQCCVAQSDCSSCVQGGGWWCPVDGQCHAAHSLSSPCLRYESIREDKMCQCSPASCTPQPGLPPTVCTWYEDVTHSRNPDEWHGGDFLPAQYRHAAKCACSGCGPTGSCSRLWGAGVPATSCIRTALLHGHQAINATMRRAIAQTPYAELHRIVPYFYDMHVDAYRQCCCSGKPAPLVDWEAIFYAADVLPCDTPEIGELAMILKFGRCGCGF